MTARKPSTDSRPCFRRKVQPFGLVWIDGRATDPEKETGDMSLRSSVYSPDGKQIDEQVVKSRVCECCSTAAAETSEGVIVAFRNRSADEVRNIYVSRFVAGHWSTPTAVHDDAWRINACPINGPAVSASGRDVAVAWFNGKDDKGRAFVAFSHDAGRTFGSAIRIDDASSLGRFGVQMLGDGSAAVTYIEFTNNHSQFRVRPNLSGWRALRPGDHRRYVRQPLSASCA